LCGLARVKFGQADRASSQVKEWKFHDRPNVISSGYVVKCYFRHFSFSLCKSRQNVISAPYIFAREKKARQQQQKQKQQKKIQQQKKKLGGEVFSAARFYA
jgi:chaperonin GroEL (HSP60 family)